ncbi:DUF4843 domain-containing protein [Mangrovibacterium diazotrophicum]|uniref:Uncharacterized protein DUF4843 n=1 Tax=Mangrovibacterium diazotrophicum TaxID=1261403 RepID=A0A419VXC5_9BACT|nr:DUF4843 domain-containing protein [Mangrovibacterium diazotrophicum]RKD87885.1 uncharacterized protein DUF4843 [Mangrovibacterium diazotrophicum]
MKKFSLILINAVIALAGLFTACSEDYPAVYEGKPYLSFPLAEDGGNFYVQGLYQNFYYYDDESRTRDTVYVPLVSVAAIPTENLVVELNVFDSDTVSWSSQVDENTVNAVSGEDYLPFDSDEMKKNLVFHAGLMQDTIPVIILRNEAMKTKTFRLTFCLANSENALAADGEDNRVVIYITDRLSKPSNWDDYYFGAYGDVKLDFMIRHSDLKWNSEDLQSVLDDSFLTSYYKYKFKQDLIKENEALGADGPLREADGTVVSFEYY